MRPEDPELFDLMDVIAHHRRHRRVERRQVRVLDVRELLKATLSNPFFLFFFVQVENN